MEKANTIDHDAVPIEDHPEYGDVLDNIKKYGDWNKEELIDCLYDPSGEGESKKYWRECYSRGELLMLVVDRCHGGTFQ